jgi:hypothetical protein
MNQPQPIQRRRTKGWRLPPNTISVARPGLWGNPHRIGVNGCGDAKTAVLWYEQDLLDLTLKDKNQFSLLSRVHELRGKNLACFCKPGEPCHRDVLLKYANLEDGNE